MVSARHGRAALLNAPPLPSEYHRTAATRRSKAQVEDDGRHQGEPQQRVRGFEDELEGRRDDACAPSPRVACIPKKPFYLRTVHPLLCSIRLSDHRWLLCVC